MESIMHGKPKLIQKNHGYTERFCKIVERLMSKDPKNRLSAREYLEMDYFKRYEYGFSKAKEILSRYLN
jgi:serine/threonine protein kinase